MSGHDALGARMKENYELRARPLLPRRTYTVVRLDGKNFHSYTRHLERPFDVQLVVDMAETAQFLCQQVQGVRLAYVQSDEISLILTDFATPHTQAWFDGNQQKIVSISASMATAKFNQLRPDKLAFFDSRAFTIPDPIEVENYLIWRQKDAVRNSISMTAQSKFSPKQLHGKSTNEMQEMLFTEHGLNWNEYDPMLKRGTVVYPATQPATVTYTDKRDDSTQTIEVERRVWKIAGAPIFTQERDWLAKHGLHRAPLEEAKA